MWIFRSPAARPRGAWITAVCPLFTTLGLTFAGCAGEPPATVERGEDVALGVFKVRVTQVERLSSSYLAEAFQAPPGSSFLAVRLRVDWAVEVGELRSLRSIDELVFNLMTGFTLEDVADNDYGHPLAMPSVSYRMMRSSGSIATMTPQDLDMLSRSSGGTRLPTDWFTVFAVPPEARDFRLRINNRDARDDQPRRVMVALGR